MPVELLCKNDNKHFHHKTHKFLSNNNAEANQLLDSEI